MRQIPDHVLEMIAGGGASDTGSIATLPTVTVTGPGGGGGGGWDPGPWDPYPYPGPGEGGGGGGGGDNPEPPPCHHSSPAPAQAPSGVNLDKLRDMVGQLSNQIKGMSDSNRIEYGAFIYRSSDGALHTTALARGDEDSSPISFQPSAGDKIVGWLHSHPVDPVIDERFPSTPRNSSNGIGDTGAARNLLNNTTSVDPGMLMYILDAKSGQAYEYTAAGGDNRSLGNNVTADATC
ncbi:protein of unknown function [Duganella sacchari]|uniref:Uncharacterized protein n=1 Tax=Duganella sacchari TaxID=551987 RepID=A0A1M7PQR3_9BURK|nr:hypothetical protein [Duganella sacchari]SHN19650.1 protein of unknown function [Duganella sacchari]